MQPERPCPQCGNAIIGRADKRYCSDQCRYLLNNTRKRQNEGEQLLARINASLRKNRSILKQFSPMGKTTINRKTLELAGFDFRYHTHLYRTQKGSIYYFCYDYGFLLLEEEKALIVNWQPYMEKKI